MNNFGRNLKVLMSLRGISSNTLAKSIKVSPITVAQWRAGSHLPQPRHVRALAKKLDVPAPRLYSDDILDVLE